MPKRTCWTQPRMATGALVDSTGLSDSACSSPHTFSRSCHHLLSISTQNSLLLPRTQHRSGRNVEGLSIQHDRPCPGSKRLPHPRRNARPGTRSIPPSGTNHPLSDFPRLFQALVRIRGLAVPLRLTGWTRVYGSSRRRHGPQNAIQLPRACAEEGKYTFPFLLSLSHIPTDTDSLLLPQCKMIVPVDIRDSRERRGRRVRGLLFAHKRARRPGGAVQQGPAYRPDRPSEA